MCSDGNNTYLHKFLFKHKKDYKTDIRTASFEITLTKLERPQKHF